MEMIHAKAHQVVGVIGRRVLTTGHDRHHPALNTAIQRTPTMRREVLTRETVCNFFTKNVCNIVFNAALRDLIGLSAMRKSLFLMI